MGSLEAEMDMHFLEEAFVEKSELASLKSLDDQKFILLGRTGSGKTAILQKIAKSDSGVPIKRISPEDISLNYLADSPILGFFREQNIKLDFAYKQIWKHILVCNLLESHLGHTKTNIEKVKSFFGLGVTNIEKYVAQLDDGKLSLETERIVKVLEEDLSANIITEYKLGIPNFISGLDGNLVEVTKKITKERGLSQEYIKNTASRIIQKSIFKETDNLMKKAETTIFNSTQKKYYIVIDDLDKDWVNEEIVYDLIKCLMYAIREFKNFKGVKIIIALRENLYRIVVNKAIETRGEQSEKFDSCTLTLGWTKDELEDLINKRLSFIFKERYTNNVPKIKDILKENEWQYMLDRTLMRPRDLIDFFNKFITEFAKDSNSEISNSSLIKSAEKIYSQNRLKALNDEWNENYGNLELIYGFIAKQKTGFTMPTIATHFDTFVSEKHNEMVLNANFARKFKDELDEYANTMNNTKQLLTKFLVILYDIGLIGFKDDSSKILYAYENAGTILTENNMNVKHKFYVHKMFRLALGTITSRDDRKA